MVDQVLYFEDVDEGDEAPVRSWLLTRTDLVMYAGASGDDNPMHHDEVLAQQAGQPSVFGHGMFSMGFLGTAITDYVGMANIRRYRARFVRQTWPDEELRTAIAVAGKRVEGDDHLVDLDVRLTNAAGEVKVLGEVTVVVPSRA